MSFLKCYICTNDTTTKKGWLTSDHFISLCRNCEKSVNEKVNLFPEHKTRFAVKMMGMRKHPESRIRRYMMEIERNKVEEILDYIFIQTKLTQGMMILTNKQLICFIPKVDGGSLGNKPRIGNILEYQGNIEDIVELKSSLGFGSEILIRDKGGNLGVLDNKITSYDEPVDVQKFINNFNNLKSSSSSSSSSVEKQSNQDVDGIEQLTKLKSLLDAGVLTQEEFDEKKKSILERM